MPRLQWRFPITRPHAGVPLADGRTGILVWGQDDVRLTLGRAGFWDHRGGTEFASVTTYSELRQYLEAGDAEAITKIFGQPGGIYGNDRPHQMSGGRLVLTPPRGVRLLQAELDHEAGTITVYTSEGSLSICLLIDTEQIHIRGADNWRVRLLPAWEVTQDNLAELGMVAPTVTHDGTSGSFVQPLPEDVPLAVAWRRHTPSLSDDNEHNGDVIVARTIFGVHAGHQDQAIEQARQSAEQAVESVEDTGKTLRWWRKYWARVPYIRTNDPVLDEIVLFGLYQQACVTPPHGTAATLQGPYLEDYQIPPWSCDYHFNINIQMIYWPLLASGQWQHFQPMWQLIRSWMPVLQANGAAFFGEPEAIMLPHAVDDRCAAVGSFWTGSIDHGCTAWMAHLAWLHYQYSGDEEHLREIAWPMLRGAWAGYRAMLEENGEHLSLPVSVSPEFAGCEMHAWGRDASFQLAACHAVLADLPQAAAVLGEAVADEWADVAGRLPAYSTVVAPRTAEQPQITTERIGLWQGQDLPESHRHHSHLAALYPFATVDPDAPEHQAIVSESLFHWQRQGPGAWSGWCVPWAATLLARSGNTDGAVRWLHTWNEWFVNEGRGTLHDARCPGLSTLCSPKDLAQLPIDAAQREIMQLDARFGALTTVFELFLQQRGDVLHLFPGVISTPRRWTAQRLRAPGGLLIDLYAVGGRLRNATITATRPYTGRIAHHLGEQAHAGDEPLPAIVAVSLAAGETVAWTSEPVVDALADAGEEW